MIGSARLSVYLKEILLPRNAEAGHRLPLAARSRPRRGGGLTPAGRRRLSEAMKQRWAQGRRGATSTAGPARVSAGTATKTKKRGGITAAGRKKLSEAMKKRWAEKKRKAS